MVSLVFGIGKRICPGRHLVEATLFVVVVSSIFSVFNRDVTKAKDENGNEIPVKVAIAPDPGVIMRVHLLAHNCFLKLRDRIFKTSGQVRVFHS